MIYLKLKYQPKNIKELLLELFSYFDDGFYSIETFFDPECNDLECCAYKMRSADDIVEIVQTYFPQATEEEIFRELIYLRIEDIEDEDDVWYPFLAACDDIQRPTIAYCMRDGIQFYDEFDSDELDDSKYKNWATICKMIGLDSQEEVEGLD